MRGAQVPALVLLLLATVSMGCASVPAYPTYAETVAEWDPIPAEHGRVVIYSLSGGSRTNPDHALDVYLDGQTEILVPGGLFAFADLSAGTHLLHYAHLKSETEKLLAQMDFALAGTSQELFQVGLEGLNSSLRRDMGVAILDLSAGETVYVLLRRDQDPAILPAAQAEAHLAGLQHKYRSALPFN